MRFEDGSHHSWCQAKTHVFSKNQGVLRIWGVFFGGIFDGPDIWPQWCNDAIIQREGEAGCEGRIIISMKGMKAYKSLKLKQHFSVDSIKSPNKFHQDLNFQAKAWTKWMAKLYTFSSLENVSNSKHPLTSPIQPVAWKALETCHCPSFDTLQSYHWQLHSLRHEKPPGQTFHPSYRVRNKAAKRKNVIR